MLFESILTEKWEEEERVPSVRELAVSVEVNPNTVLRTYSYLQENDIIFNRRGMGYFVSPGAKEKIKAIKREQFVKTELPHIVATMKLLGIDFDQLQSLYEENA
jgi:DNA-binding transcriptional regulator YhcF (GntR family)